MTTSTLPTAQTADSAVAAAPTVTRHEGERVEAPRVRGTGFGGPRLKMAVQGTIPGHHLYWANDDEGALEQLLYEGFSYVTQKEVSLSSNIVPDQDLTTRVSRYVGTKADGSPMRAFLLKCPEDIWQERESERYSQADAWDSAIRAGKVQPDSGRYTPKGVRITNDTEFKQSY